MKQCLEIDVIDLHKRLGHIVTLNTLGLSKLAIPSHPSVYFSSKLSIDISYHVIFVAVCNVNFVIICEKIDVLLLHWQLRVHFYVSCLLELNGIVSRYCTSYLRMCANISTSESIHENQCNTKFLFVRKKSLLETKRGNFIISANFLSFALSLIFGNSFILSDIKLRMNMDWGKQYAQRLQT